MARARSRFQGILQRRPSARATGPRGGLGEFFGEVISELKKVTWPTREEATRLTMLVLAISLSVGLALSLLDLLFREVFDLLLF